MGNPARDHCGPFSVTITTGITNGAYSYLGEGRAYWDNPAWVKSVAPKLAAELSEEINSTANVT